MTEYVCGFLFASGRVALIRKNRPAWRVEKLNGIGGHIEDGEMPLTAMVREFREETGYRTLAADWAKRVVLTGPDYRVHFFAAHFRLVPALQDSNEGEISWHDPLRLPAAVIKNLFWLVPFCADTDISDAIEVTEVAADKS